jgi:phosphate transport system substrate-binding protein
MKMLSFRSMRALAGAIALLIASVASAQPAPFVPTGGGSSLITPALRAEAAALGMPISYASVDSGRGIAGFLMNDASQFRTGSIGTVHFGTSEIALAPGQVDAAGSYARSATDGRLIQLPYVVTPVTIPYVSAPTDITAPISLDGYDLCGIFSGKIKNWNQVSNPANNLPYTQTSAPITVVYARGRSGITDLLVRHLATICTRSNSDVLFYPEANFEALFPPNGMPANFVGEWGNEGVAARLTLLRNAGSAAIGYLSPPYTNTTLAPGSAVAAENQFAVANLRNANLGQDFAPTYQNATLALATAQPPSTDADKADPFSWVPHVPNPLRGYPISGTSNVIVSQCYLNRRVVGKAISNWLWRHYNDANLAQITNDYGFDTLPGTYVSAINADLLANYNGLNLNVMNPQFCGASGLGR